MYPLPISGIPIKNLPPNDDEDTKEPRKENNEAKRHVSIWQIGTQTEKW